MSARQETQVRQGVKLVAATTLGVLVGGAMVLVYGVQQPQVVYPDVSKAMVSDSAGVALSAVSAGSAEEVAALLNLTDRERKVLARLANLPDLPVVQTPAFDVKVQSAPTNSNQAAVARVSPKKHEQAAPALPAGEAVIARIQVVSVEKNRVFYRSVDEQMHTARVGERLLGVDGRVLAIDEHGAVLQIDGQRMRVAANNM